MNLGHHNFWIFTRKNLVQETRGRFFGKSAVFSTLHVQTFDLQLIDIFAVDLHQIDRRILLLGMKQKSAENVVDINLEKLISLVDGALELLPKFKGIFNAVCVGIDHD